ncbi:hypothetical protein FQN51_006171 [Onygenales sp. PD_10]|nr:hypothetical protein FQN51_006171 [Onygenales sp. PD_10]
MPSWLVYTLFYCTAVTWIGLLASIITLIILHEIRHPGPYEDEETKYLSWIFISSVTDHRRRPGPTCTRSRSRAALSLLKRAKRLRKAVTTPIIPSPAANNNPPFFKTILTTYTIKMITHTLQEEEEEEEELQKESLLPITASTPLLTQQPHPPTQHEENHTHPTTSPSPTLLRRLVRPLFYFMIFASIGIFINLVVLVVLIDLPLMRDEIVSEDEDRKNAIWLFSSLASWTVTMLSVGWLGDLKQRMDETQTQQPLQSQSASPIPFHLDDFQLDEEAAMYTIRPANYNPHFFIPSFSRRGLRGEFNREYEMMMVPPRPASCAF